MSYGEIDKIPLFSVGDKVETTAEYTKIMRDLNTKHCKTKHELKHKGVIKEVIKSKNETLHIFLDNYDLPLGIRFLKRVKG